MLLHPPKHWWSHPTPTSLCSQILGRYLGSQRHSSLLMNSGRSPLCRGAGVCLTGQQRPMIITIRQTRFAPLAPVISKPETRPSANTCQEHCPVRFIINWVKHLRTHRAPLTTTIYSYYDCQWQRIDTTTLTANLRQTVIAMGHEYGITAAEISLHSLRSSGAMPLFCARVNTNMIRLLGRWRSDEMLRYLHVQSFPLLSPLAAQMLRHGNFTLVTNHNMG
jgi:hypothetical protein